MPIKLFTNFLTYRLSQPLHPSDPEALSEALSQKPARPLGSQELSCMGFIEPMDTEGEYAELIRPGMVFISARKSERLLPGKVVRQAVDAKVREIEEDQMRKVYAKDGIARRSWARNEEAIFAIKRAMEDEPLLKVTLPNLVDEGLL